MNGLEEEADQALADFFRRNMDQLSRRPPRPEFRVQVDQQHLGGGSAEPTYVPRKKPLVQQPVLAPAPPEIDTVDPEFGPNAGGTVVTITGSNFHNPNLKVIFIFPSEVEIEQPISNVSDDFTEITFTTEFIEDNPTDPREVDIKVINDFGEDIKLNAFDYYIPVRIDVIVPNTGFVDGGTQVTLYGAGFRPNDLVVWVDDIDVGDCVVTPDHTQATFFTPAHAEGSVDVRAESVPFEHDFNFPLGFTYFDVPPPPYNIFFDAFPKGITGQLTLNEGQATVVQFFAHDTNFPQPFVPGFNEKVLVSADFMGNTDTTLFMSVNPIQFNGGTSAVVMQGFIVGAPPLARTVTLSFASVDWPGLFTLQNLLLIIIKN